MPSIRVENLSRPGSPLAIPSQDLAKRGLSLPREELPAASRWETDDSPRLALARPSTFRLRHGREFSDPVATSQHRIETQQATRLFRQRFGVPEWSQMRPFE